MLRSLAVPLGAVVLLSASFAHASMSIVADLDSNATTGPDTLLIEPTDTVIVYFWFTGTDSIGAFGVTLGDTSGALTWVEEADSLVYDTPAGWTDVSVSDDSLGWILLQSTDFSFSTPIHGPYQFAQLKFFVTPGDSCGSLDWDPDLSGWFESSLGESAFTDFETPLICVSEIRGRDGGGEDGGSESMSPLLSSTPLRITENLGQYPSEVRYYVRGNGGTVYFTDSGIVSELTIDRQVAGRHRTALPRLAAASPDTIITTRAIFRAEFLEADANVVLSPGEALPGRINHYRGNDSSRWVENARSYSTLTYESLYPGIDLVYREQDGHLKYDFVLSPGADISDIRLRYRGVSNVDVTPEGSLELEIGGAVLEEAKPYVYQSVEGREVEIPGEYVVSEDGILTFDVDPVSRNAAIVIDPGLLWSSYLGGSDNEEGWGVCFDSLGNVVLVGRTTSDDFPGTTGVEIDTFSAGWDAYVTKFASTGDSLIFSTFIGGDGTDGAYGVAVDPDSNIFVTGETSSEDFPTVLAAQSTKGTGKDIFLAKLTDVGELLYSSFYGPAGQDQEAWDLALGSSGKVFVAGYTKATVNSPPNPLVVRFDPDEPPAHQYSVAVAGGASGSVLDNAWGIEACDEDRVVITGETQSSDYPSTFVDNAVPSEAEPKAFITKLYSNLTSVEFSRIVGVESLTVGTDIKLDSDGSIVICGLTKSRYLFRPGFPMMNMRCDSPYDTLYNDINTSPYAPRSDAFVMRFNPDADTLICGSYLGGSLYDRAFGVETDTSGGIYLTGSTMLSGFPMTSEEDTLFDVFLVKFSPDIAELTFSRTMNSGNRGIEEGFDVATWHDGLAAVTGYTIPFDENHSFEVSEGAYDESWNGGTDAFVSMFEIVDCGPSNVSVADGEVPLLTPDIQTYPNPFNPAVTIRYSLNREASVVIEIFSVTGRRVRLFDEGRRIIGAHSVIWDGTSDSGIQCTSGVYLVRLTVEKRSMTRKLTLVR